MTTPTPEELEASMRAGLARARKIAEEMTRTEITMLEVCSTCAYIAAFMCWHCEVEIEAFLETLNAQARQAFEAAQAGKKAADGTPY